MPFGAFIDLPGFRKGGMIHSSQLSWHRVRTTCVLIQRFLTICAQVDQVTDVLNEGDEKDYVKANRLVLLQLP